MNARRICCAISLLLGLATYFQAAPVLADGPAQMSYQKGYGAKQKGAYAYGFGYGHEHRHHICLPPPDGPLLQSVAILRVPPPRREIRFRPPQESAAESAEEEAQSEIDRLKERMKQLELRFDQLFHSVDKLVDKLQPPAAN